MGKSIAKVLRSVTAEPPVPLTAFPRLTHYRALSHDLLRPGQRLFSRTSSGACNWGMVGGG